MEKNKLTNQLKKIETEIHESRVEMNSIQYKLKIAYDYEDELISALSLARARTENIKKDLFTESSKLSSLYEKMKSIFDIFTANFYKD